MAQWANVDGPVLEAVWQVLEDAEYASENAVLGALGWVVDQRLAVMRSMRRLIDTGYIVGKVSTGDATIQDVMATSLTEKGLQTLGLWPAPNQGLAAALIIAMREVAETAEPAKATVMRRVADELESIGADVLVKALQIAYQHIKNRLRLP
jgi:hypothetical protein